MLSAGMMPSSAVRRSASRFLRYGTHRAKRRITLIALCVPPRPGEPVPSVPPVGNRRVPLPLRGPQGGLIPARKHIFFRNSRLESREKCITVSARSALTSARAWIYFMLQAVMMEI